MLNHNDMPVTDAPSKLLQLYTLLDRLLVSLFFLASGLAFACLCLARKVLHSPGQGPLWKQSLTVWF